MTDLVKFAGANLPAVATLTQSLRALEADIGPGAGSVILKMDRTGHWVFGADQTENDRDALWAINPFSFVHGYIAWGDGDVLGEKMAPVSDPLPMLDAAPAGARNGWQLQLGMGLRCMSGEDAGLEARYTVTSVGGKRAVQALAAAIAAQVERDQSTPVPVVLLKAEHYQHKSYGRIYTPIFDVQKWIGLDGEAPESGAEATPTNRRQRA